MTKLNATGDALIYSTYLGGSSREEIFGIAVVATGDVYLTGQITSTDSLKDKFLLRVSRLTVDFSFG